MATRARSLRPFGLLLAGALCLPALPVEAALMAGLPDAAAMEQQVDGEWVAKKGGKGGGGKKGGGSRKKSSKGKNGFKSSSSSMSKGSKKPKGGWKKTSNKKNNPSINSKSSKKNNQKSNKKQRQKERDRREDKWDKRYKKSEKKRDKREKKWDKRYDKRTKKWDKRYDRWDDRWDRYPGWARPGWGYARPWNYGWYDSGYRSSNWGWNAAAFGLTTLTTAAIINSAVDNAVSNQTSYVVVPNSDYRLLYGTVEPINDQSVRFAVEAGSGETYFDADCNRGTLNGRNPTSASEAELLNAACQVAFGSV
jgi:hypothetical protein